MKILSTARAVPKNQISNDDLSSIVETSDEWISSRTGIQTRFISSEENTSDLCGNVAAQLLERSGVAPEKIDLIVVATMTPDYLTPSVACLVQEKIGANNAFAFDLNAACSGFVYALSVAEKMIRSGSYHYVMVIGGEVLSKVVDWQDRATCVLFGDGAGGILLAEGDTHFLLAEDLHSDGSKAMSLTAANMPVRNYLVPSAYAFDPLFMVGRDIFNFAYKEVSASIVKVLNDAQLSMEDISYIIPHQANYRIVESVAKKLKIPVEMFYTNMDVYGNTSAASIPIALDEMVSKGLVRLGHKEKVLLVGFGGGLTWGSVIIEL